MDSYTHTCKCRHYPAAWCPFLHGCHQLHQLPTNPRASWEALCNLHLCPHKLNSDDCSTLHSIGAEGKGVREGMCVCMCVCVLWHPKRRCGSVCACWYSSHIRPERKYCLSLPPSYCYSNQLNSVHACTLALVHLLWKLLTNASSLFLKGSLSVCNLKALVWV